MGLNALRSPGERPAAVLAFLRLGCQSEPGLPVGKQACWKLSSSPRDLELGSCGLLEVWGGGEGDPFETYVDGVWLGSTLSQAK